MYSYRFAVFLVASTLTLSALAEIPETDPGADQEFVVEVKRVTGIELSGRIGVLSGQADEFVYEYDHKLSELNWDLEGLALAGLHAGYRKGKLGWDADIATVLNEGSGQMTDYDWFAPGYDWTHRSISDNVVDSFIMLDLNASYEFLNRKWGTLRALLGIKYNSLSMYDQGGTFIYSYKGFRDIAGSFPDGTGIEYEQEYIIPYLGVTVESKPGRLTWQASLAFSPYVSATDKDRHLLRTEYGDPNGILFEGEFEGGTAIMISANAKYRFGKNLFWTAGIESHVVDEFEGDVTISTAGVSEFDEDGAGVAINYTAFSVGLGMDI